MGVVPSHTHNSNPRGAGYIATHQHAATVEGTQNQMQRIRLDVQRLAGELEDEAAHKVAKLAGIRILILSQETQTTPIHTHGGRGGTVTWPDATANGWKDHS